MTNKIRTYVKANGAVMLLVSYKHKQFQLSAGMKTSEKFSGTTFPETERNHKAKSLRLTRFLVACEEYMLLHDEEPVERMKASLRGIVLGVEAKEKVKPLWECINMFAATKSVSTGNIYQITAKRICAYDAEATFSDVDKKWLEAYRDHELKRGRKLNGVAIDLRNIRAVFNWAMDEEMTTSYPFRKFSIKTERTRHLFLPAEQLRVLRDYPVEPYQEVYRDIFMLGFYLIGINISDLLKLKRSDMRFGRISYYRNKTHRLYDIKVEPEAQDIIEKYKGTKHLLRFLDDGCNARTFTHNINDALKKVGKMEIVRNKRGAYIKKAIDPLFPEISWYTARRSWATLAAQLDIPKEIIGKALGHAEWDSTTTDIYIAFDNKKIDAANRKILDFLAKNG